MDKVVVLLVFDEVVKLIDFVFLKTVLHININKNININISK